jgi:hypothetical protein
VRHSTSGLVSEVFAIVNVWMKKISGPDKTDLGWSVDDSVAILD